MKTTAYAIFFYVDSWLSVREIDINVFYDNAILIKHSGAIWYVTAKKET